MDNNGVRQCSPDTCVDISTGSTTTTPDTSSYTNNGTIDPNTGSCLGQLFFFNGKGSECRPPGVNTTFFDCCNTGDGGLLGFLKYCRQTEADTVTALNAKRCHALGDYCVTSWKILGCVQRARVYCCFNSMLGRIIQEQGRPQLQKFAPDGGWGSPIAPNCVGFKPEEFQMLDFSKIDLSEYTNSINETVSTQIQQKMNDSVNRFFNSTQ
jgi:conjugal transfer mating pair stabilization protein TraN